MSDEREQRDGGDAERAKAAGSTPDDSTPAGTDSAVSRPTGKRSSRRARATGDDGAPTPAATSAIATKSRPTPKRAEASVPKKENIFKRLRRFFREVIAELRKVIWPNRKQMITYTSVVLVFVIFMVAFISGLDIAFTKGVSWLFG